MEVLSCFGRVIIGFFRRRALVLGRIHVVSGEVTTNCTAVGLILRYRDIEFAGCFHQVLWPQLIKFLLPKEGASFLHLLVVGQKNEE